RERVAFDPSVVSLPSANALPLFLTFPIASATAGQVYYYPASASDEDGDDLSYLLVRGPAGMTVGTNSGLVTWTPSATSPEQVDVVLQVYDSAGAHDTQAYTVQVAGVNRQPVLTAVPIHGTEGESLEIAIQAHDSEDDLLIYWADRLPPG